VGGGGRVGFCFLGFTNNEGFSGFSLFYASQVFETGRIRPQRLVAALGEQRAREGSDLSV